MSRIKKQRMAIDNGGKQEQFTEGSSAEVKTNGPETKNGIIINSLFVNARREPSLESEVVEILKKGDSVRIIDRIGGFYKICTILDELAYVSSEFVTEE